MNDNTSQPLSALAWRILSILLSRAEEHAKGEPLVDTGEPPLTRGYYAAWTLTRLLGTSDMIDPVNVKYGPRNAHEHAMRELIDKGLVEEMSELPYRFRLRVQKEQES